MRFEFVTREQQLEDLAPEWKRLSQQSASSYQFFQDWCWVSSWWYALAPLGRYELRILVARAGNSVVMIWPWVLNRHHGLRILEPMGGLMSCFDDALVADKHRNRQDLLLAWNFLLANTVVDAIELKAVHECANIASLLEDVGSTPINVDSAPFIDMEAFDDFGSYLASRSKSMRKNQRRSAKHLATKGALRGNGDDQQMSADVAIDTSLSFKAQWLKAKGLPGKTLLTDDARTFLKQVCSQYTQPSANARLCVSSLHLDDEPVSINIGFRHNGCHYDYLGSFDYRLERFGPGRLCTEYGIYDGFEKCMANYNMLTPDTGFKKGWADEAAAVRHYIIAFSARGKLYRDVYKRKFRPRLKKIYNSLPPNIRARLAPGRLWG